MLALCTIVLATPATAVPRHDAAALRAKYAELLPQLQHNQFNRPLYLESTEQASTLAGDIYAVVDYAFSDVNTAFNSPARWCDMLILHLNTKYCHTTSQAGKPGLRVSIGKKIDAPLKDAYPVSFVFNVAEATPVYLDVQLDSKDGPMGTSDYRILLEAVALADGHTFIHLTYSYAYGMAASIAMRAYLATVGSGKVGFTRMDNGSGAKPEYIGGVRGVVERNTMRYYLAIDAYLSGLGAPPSEQLERRLGTWFTATERYPRQLHEVERDAYLNMKRNEYQRQQLAP